MSTDSDRPVVLVSVPNEVEAAAIATLLSANGIQVLTTGGYTAGLRAEAPGMVQVIVRQKDVDSARGILASSSEQSTIDWSQVDVGDKEET